MSFIDWSDSEGMFDLFIEFLRDEMNASVGDASRKEFVAGLLERVRSWNEGLQVMNSAGAIRELKAIHESIDEEFQKDPVFLHLIHLIDELERIG